MSKTDEDLREPIERELKMEPGLDAAAVAVKDGTVTCRRGHLVHPEVDVLALLVQGGGPDAAELAACEAGLNMLPRPWGPRRRSP
jgi:hypothetical protein